MIFSEITDNPLKSQIIGPKIHQTVAQLTDSDLPFFTKAFCNNRGQNSLGERGRIHFYLPLPESVIRHTVTSSPNFLKWILYHYLLSMELHNRVPGAWGLH